MEQKILVSYEREGAGFIQISGGDGVEHVECGQHHAAFISSRILRAVGVATE
jgi:hypothetical protein